MPPKKRPSAEPLPETSDVADAFLLLTKAFIAVGTPEAKDVARILSYVRTAYFRATVDPRPAQRAARARAIKLAEHATAKILNGKRPPLIGMRRHEVLRDHYEMVRSTLAAKGTKDAVGLIVMVLASMVRVYMPDLPRAADPKLPELIRKEIRRVEMSDDELKLTRDGAARLVERTLVVAGMGPKQAHQVTTILRK